MAAAAFVAAAVVVSCRGKLSEAESLKLGEVPIQVVDKIFMINSENGAMNMRMEADVMEKYDNDTCTYEMFPQGFAVYGYNSDGLLETLIISDKARHHKSKKNSFERWEAFGNVVVQNVIKQETMETDTLYWDQAAHEIFTDCYVRMYSSEGFMQGYGMRSDEHARNSIIFKPFNSYGVVVQDTTAVVIDSVNFIGPLLKK